MERNEGSSSKREKKLKRFLNVHFHQSQKCLQFLAQITVVSTTWQAAF